MRLLELVAPALVTCLCRLRLAILLRPVLLRAILLRPILELPVVSMAIPIPIAIPKSAMVPPVGAVVPVPVVAMTLMAILPVAFIAAVLARGLMRLGHLRLRLETLVEHILDVVVAKLVASLTFGSHALTVAVHHVARLLQLLAVRHDDARVVLGVLQIVLRQNRIARGLGIASQGQVFLGNMRRRAPNFDIRPVRLEAAG